MLLTGCHEDRDVRTFEGVPLTDATVLPTADVDGHRAAAGLTLTTTNSWVPGATADLSVTGAAPGESIYFAVTAQGTGMGPCPAGLGGHCLDLLSPILLGDVTADANGIAEMSVALPANLALGTVLDFQAIAVRGFGGVDSVLSPPLSGGVVVQSWDGAYTGSITIDVDILGVTDTCVGTMTIDVDEAASPQIRGEAFGLSCAGFGADLTFTGDIVADPMAAGDIDIEVGLFGSDTGVWDGVFSGNQLDGVSAGTAFGILDYDATFTVVR